MMTLLSRNGAMKEAVRHGKMEIVSIIAQTKANKTGTSLVMF
jgi:hypothetical protein